MSKRIKYMFKNKAENGRNNICMRTEDIRAEKSAHTRNVAKNAG